MFWPKRDRDLISTDPLSPDARNKIDNWRVEYNRDVPIRASALTQGIRGKASDELSPRAPLGQRQNRSWRRGALGPWIEDAAVFLATRSSV